MKEIPILFSTPMVQARLNGTKTQTRRKVKDLILDEESGYAFFKNKHQMDIHNWKDEILKFCPYGKVGDVLWVRETWCEMYDTEDHPELEGNPQEKWSMGIGYRADGKPKYMYDKWKPSIFMPKEACRIKLLIKDVRIERLQDISEFDARNEGYDILVHDGGSSVKWFEKLWQSINGKESWDANPYVWVIYF